MSWAPMTLDITIGMEPTARLEVRVTDNQGKPPVKGALVSTWPNVRCMA